MPKFGVKHSKWKSPEFNLQLTCTGGLLGTKPEPVETGIHPVTKGTFVKMTKSQRWLQRMVAGTAHAWNLGASKLLDELSKKMVAASDDGDGPPDADDPMSTLDYDDHGNGLEPVESADKEKKIAMNTLVSVSMPYVCPAANAHGDGHEQKHRVVKLWYRGNKRIIWLALEDVVWAASYMRVELDTCGVPPCFDDTDHASSKSSSESGSPANKPAGIRWDFSRNAWSFGCEGGDNSHFVSPEDLRPEDIPAEKGSMQQLSYEEKKALAYERACMLALEMQ